MKNQLIIRKAKLGDEKGINEFTREGIKRKNWLYTGRNIAPKNEKRIKEKLKSKEEVLFVAIVGGKIIGSTGISFKKTGRTRHRVDLGWGVHPDYQGRGIGTKLVSEALKYAKKEGFKIAIAEVAYENIASMKMAKKCKFKIVGRIKEGLLTDDKRYIDTAILWREL